MCEKYIFETESTRDMELVLARYKMISILEDFNEWRRSIYKGYDNDIKYLCNGKLYSFVEFEKNKNDFPKDENGFIKNLKSVYVDTDIINKIDDLLYEIQHLLYY